MNIIEQLGGYEKAASLFNGCPWDSGTVDVPNPFSKGMLRLDLGELRSELLEYRRQHNIFEVGDRIIFNIMGNSVMEYEDCLNMFLSQGLIRHATDEEIKAGKRL